MAAEDEVTIRHHERFGGVVDGPGTEPAPCMRCRHRWRGSIPAKCWAFPSGIPRGILLGEQRHDVPRPDLGQVNQLVYEPGSDTLTMEE